MSDLAKMGYAFDMKVGKPLDFFEVTFENGEKVRYEPRTNAEWVPNTRYRRKGKTFLDCSRCHYGENGDVICEVSKVPNYCPNCGARIISWKGGGS